MATADTTQPPENTQGNPNSGKRKFMLLVLAAAVVLSGAGVWAYHEFYGRWSESTDDAYVNGNVVEITPLVTGVFLVVPGQPRAALGPELLVVGIAIGTVLLVIDARAPRWEQETRLTWLMFRVFPAVASCGCLAIAGATLLAQAGGGLYWVVPSVVAAIFFGLVNAWVLLVEILR